MMFTFFINTIFLHMYEGQQYAAIINESTVGITLALFFAPITIIGICTYLIIRWRKTDKSKIKWMICFIGLSVFMMFAVLNVGGVFDDLYYDY